MAITRARAGGNSAFFRVPYVGTGQERSLTNEQWDQLPAGNLKAFLSHRFVTESGEADSALFVREMGNVGFRVRGYLMPTGPISVLMTGLRLSRGPSDPLFPTLPAGIVLLTLEGTEDPLVDPGYVVQLSVSYSASE